jgi:hypothetical protein
LRTRLSTSGCGRATAAGSAVGSSPDPRATPGTRCHPRLLLGNGHATPQVTSSNGWRRGGSCPQRAFSPRSPRHDPAQVPNFEECSSGKHSPGNLLILLTVLGTYYLPSGLGA